MRFFLFALSVGCTPHLKSSARATCGGEELQNTWNKSVPPQTLVSEGSAKGQVAADFCMVDQHGDKTSLWQFYGDLILLDISTMWCAPCQLIAKDVDETWKDYADQGFTYLTMLPENLKRGSVDVDDLNEWADGFDITAPILADNEGYGYSVEPQRQWPAVILIDRDMTVLVERVTPSDEAIRDAIEEAL